MKSKPCKIPRDTCRGHSAEAQPAPAQYTGCGPTGADALYGLVHPHNLALGVLPIDAAGNTVLVVEHDEETIRAHVGEWLAAKRSRTAANRSQ